VQTWNTGEQGPGGCCVHGVQLCCSRGKRGTAGILAYPTACWCLDLQVVPCLVVVHVTERLLLLGGDLKLARPATSPPGNSVVTFHCFLIETDVIVGKSA